MKKFQKDTGSKNMGVILMNPQNGEIYAMADYPSYNLNDPRNLSVKFSKSKIAKMSSRNYRNYGEISVSPMRTNRVRLLNRLRLRQALTRA